ncbi:hypothetical protein LWI28_025713 [Acer negundo]|uniref:Peptidase A1 domain-containing protein n=1 Tax=Acer negundo TaxID=4023 RepID=A0AAD5JAX2_ACENE|nr:hypothetical protein LWI28_025713 [Acer negundo]
MADSLRFSASFGYLLCFCILFFSFNSYKSCVHGARELANHQNVVNKKKSLMPAPASTTGLQIAHRLGHSSPLDQENPPPTSREILLQDQSRGRSLYSKSVSWNYSNDDSGTGVELPLQEKSIGAGNFVVKVGFGTPKRDLTLMFDTGSDVTWIQCQPCDKCYDQEEPIFDPSKSSTFSDATCNTPTCPYSITYNDDSNSSGNYSQDTLTLSSTTVFPGFVFGCGRNNSANFGKVAGVLGFEPGDTSIMTQTVNNFGQEFSYCLPLEETSTGYLRFGQLAFETRQSSEISIPIVTDSTWPNKYLVKLVGITIGEKRLEMSANSVPGSLPSTILDTGTIISRLPGEVYAGLRSAFQDSMSQYPLADQSSDPMDICYDLSGSEDDINKIVPSMKLHFDDSQDLNLDPSGVVWKESDSRKVCLAFAVNGNSNDLTIIGNHQQRNLKISYSLFDKKVGFTTGGCGN